MDIATYRLNGLEADSVKNIGVLDISFLFSNFTILIGHYQKSWFLRLFLDKKGIKKRNLFGSRSLQFYLIYSFNLKNWLIF